MPKVGVVFSGAGHLDGSELHEAVLTLLALDRAGAEIVCMAPRGQQRHVVNHVTGLATIEKRNMLTEAARIARGKIEDIAAVQGAYLDALILPGGYGVTKNLCDYATKGPECEVHPEVARLLKEMLLRGKPIGAVCIASILVARIAQSRKKKVTVTIGNDPATAKDIEKLGCIHQPCTAANVVVDQQNKVVSTPAYMLPIRISEAAAGIEKLVKEVLALT